MTELETKQLEAAQECIDVLVARHENLEPLVVERIEFIEPLGIKFYFSNHDPIEANGLPAVYIRNGGR